jgi:hypothetical protein
LAATRQFDPRLHRHRRPLQPDADQFHAVVGLDQHLGEVRGRRHTLHAHGLRPERLLEPLHDRIDPRLRVHSAGLGEELLHRGQALGSRVDRAAQDRILRMARGKAADRRRQILEQHGGAAALHAQHPPRGIRDPRLSGAGEHDLTGCSLDGRVDEDVLDAGQARELRKLLRNPPAGRHGLRHFGFQP